MSRIWEIPFSLTPGNNDNRLRKKEKNGSVCLNYYWLKAQTGYYLTNFHLETMPRALSPPKPDWIKEWCPFLNSNSVLATFNWIKLKTEMKEHILKCSDYNGLFCIPNFIYAWFVATLWMFRTTSCKAKIMSLKWRCQTDFGKQINYENWNSIMFDAMVYLGAMVEV